MIPIQTIDEAARILEKVVVRTPLQLNERLSKKYGATIYLKREDLQRVRSFKIRGAYYKMSLLNDVQKNKGVVCASAGNHAQGVAYSCAALKIRGVIFMPVTAPSQKVQKVKGFGGSYVEVVLRGDTVDESLAAAFAYQKKHGSVFVHPFDDEQVITGQGTIGKEIWEELNGKIDIIMTCEGGGGLTAGIVSYIKRQSVATKVIACEPSGASGLHMSMEAGKPVNTPSVDTFVDGAAIRSVGLVAFDILKDNLDQVITVPEGQAATTMIELYQHEGVIAEPAGALAVAGLEMMDPSAIKDKTIVCTISGGNNDILRYPEVMERSLIYRGLKHYFIIEFAQKPGQLMKFLQEVLGPSDDIVLFEYMKKNNKEKGPALVGVELTNRTDYDKLLKRFVQSGLEYKEISSDDMIYRYLV